MTGGESQVGSRTWEMRLEEEKVLEQVSSLFFHQLCVCVCVSVYVSVGWAFCLYPHMTMCTCRVV